MFVMGACGGDDKGVSLKSESKSLKEVNGSGYSGEAVLTSAGDARTFVVVAIGKDGNLNGSFPVAIQRAACKGLSGEVLHELGTLESGVWSGTVPESLKDLTDGNHALVVFESNQRSVYVSCADLN